MSIFKISPVLSRDGFKYIVQKRGMFFWSCAAQCDMYRDGISRRPFERDSTFLFFDPNLPYEFNSVQDAIDWIVREYGRSSEILYWNAA